MSRLFYMETSVLSRLIDPAGSTKRRITEAFLSALRGRHKIAVSHSVFGEIVQTPGGARAATLAKRIWSLHPILLSPDPRTNAMALELLAAGRWREKRFADMRHVAYTIRAGADALVTWDERDLARDRTRVVVQAYTWSRGLAAPLIGTPEEVAAWLGVKIA